MSPADGSAAWLNAGLFLPFRSTPSGARGVGELVQGTYQPKKDREPSLIIAAELRAFGKRGAESSLSIGWFPVPHCFLVFRTLIIKFMLGIAARGRSVHVPHTAQGSVTCV